MDSPFLDVLRGAGIHPTLRDGRIWVRSDELHDEARDLLRLYRGEILAELKAERAPAPAAAPAPPQRPAGAGNLTEPNAHAPWWAAWTDADVRGWVDEARGAACAVAWDEGRVVVRPAHRYAPPWLLSEAWALSEAARDDDRLRGLLKAQLVPEAPLEAAA